MTQHGDDTIRTTRPQSNGAKPAERSEKTIGAAADAREGNHGLLETAGKIAGMDTEFAAIEPEPHAGLHFAGSLACDCMRLDAEVSTTFQTFMAQNRPVAAICHGAQLLTVTDVVRGRRLMAHRAIKLAMRAAGGLFVAVAPEKTATGENLETVPAWPAHPRLMHGLVHLVAPKTLN
jgi:protease I